MFTQLKKGREEGLKEGIEKGLKEGLEQGRKEECFKNAKKMKQAGIAFDVNCPGYRFIGSGNNVSLSSFLEKLTS